LQQRQQLRLTAAIVTNVVTSPKISVRTVVPRSRNLKNFSSMRRRIPSNLPTVKAAAEAQPWALPRLCNNCYTDVSNVS
jgi:hypothetical protein